MIPASVAPRPVEAPGPAPVRRRLPWRAATPIAVAIVLALLPVPAGLTPGAWTYFALFVGVIVGLVLEPLPAAALGLVGVAAAAVLQLPFRPGQAATKGFDAPAEAVRWALSGFSNSTVWLIFAAFMFALGYEKTGLGKRIALVLVRRLGNRTLGLGYAIALSDLILAPFTPSNTARSAGTVFPVISSIPALYGSQPGPSARRIGSYLMWTAFSVTCVTSSMFLTALAPNPLAAELVRKTVGISIGWTQWAVGILPVGILLLAVLPALVYVLYPPEVKTSREVAGWAGEQLKTLGPISRAEIAMALLVVVALALWIFGRAWVDATTVAVSVVALMVVGRIVTWEAVLQNKQAWNVLVWFATLVALADGLNRVGFVAWFTKTTSVALAGLSPTVIMVSLVIVFFFVHYLFASLTAHTTAVLPVVLAAGAAVPGLPVEKFALLLCYSLGIMGVITPYATGPGPVYYGSGYVSRRDFWKLGLVFGVIFLAVLLAVELAYL